MCLGSMIQEKVSFKTTRIPLCMVRWTLGDSYIASGPPQGIGLGHHPACFRCSPLTPLIHSMDMSFSKTPGDSAGQRTLLGCRLWGHKESDTT